MRLQSVLNIIKKPRKIIRYLGDKRLFNWLSDEKYLKLVFLFETGKRLNLNNPVTFNEKLQWLKLYDRKPEYCTYVDKYEVRDYIKKTIGEKYLIPLIGVYESVSDIPWDALPDSFVLKCTHGSGSNIICKDKSKLNIREAITKLNKWMKKNWYWFGREWPYKDLKPRIICEEFISDTGTTPDDYKIMCFNGEPRIIQVHRDRFGKGHTEDFYNLDGKRLPCRKIAVSAENELDPNNFKEMVRLARVLAKGHPYIRCDFYRVGGKVYFGELTFYDASGFTDFEPEVYNKIIGDMLKI